jgi:hypothetical protein
MSKEIIDMVDDTKESKKAKKWPYILAVIVVVAIAAYLVLPAHNSTQAAVSVRTRSINPPGNSDLLYSRNTTIQNDSRFTYQSGLSKGDKIRVYLEADSEVNTLLLNSAAFSAYQAAGTPSFKDIGYYVDGTFFAAKYAEFDFTAPDSDTYYLLVARRALIEEQANNTGNAEINVLVYKYR